MRTRVSLSVFGLVALLVAVVATTATPVSGHMGLIIDAEWLMDDCLELVPDSASVQGVTDDGSEVPLDVMVVLDVAEGAAIAQEPDEDERRRLFDALAQRAYTALSPAKVSYDGIGLSLNLRGVRLLQPLTPGGSPRDRTDHAQEIIDLAKAQFGGQRPAGYDVVYVLTDLDIQLPDVGNAVVGMADCIGGVRYPDRAFAVGQWADWEIPVGPISFYREFTAKVAGHEIGHLMGAHHHYQSCGDAVPAAVPDGDLGPCTLMTNAVDFQSFPFSQLSGAVVRGHALDFAGEHKH